MSDKPKRDVDEYLQALGAVDIVITSIDMTHAKEVLQLLKETYSGRFSSSWNVDKHGNGECRITVFTKPNGLGDSD